MRRRGEAGLFHLKTVTGLLSWLLLLAHVSGSARADTLVLQGSTTFNAELMAGHLDAIAADAHHDITVIPNKSNLGLVALLEGKADLAMISTALANETETVRRTNPDLPLDRLQGFSVARTRAAVITHPSNPIQSISNENLRRILSGEVTDWQQLGGPPMPIRVVAAREGGGVVTSVEASLLGLDKHISAPDQIRVQNGPQIVQVVEQEPGALGISLLKLTKGRQVRELVLASPIEQQLSLVSLGTPSPAMLEVIAACRKAALLPGLSNPA
jgi:phosphate transport system substrate-binding protein